LASEELDNKSENDAGDNSDVSGWTPNVLDTPKDDEEQSTFSAPAAPEKFAVYGFQLDIPENWRIELNPKATREKGDVAFHSPKGNRFFVSWGNLANAKKHFATLEAHRDNNIKKIKKGQDVRQVDLGQSYEVKINGHQALFTEVRATIRQGMFGRGAYVREMWSTHLYCENRERYFVIYCLLRDPGEYEDYSKVFKSMALSLVCH
jgi:hypothetical protein